MHDCRSHHYYAIILWVKQSVGLPKKQIVVASSSTEVEYKALAMTAGEVLWIC